MFQFPTDAAPVSLETIHTIVVNYSKQITTNVNTVNSQNKVRSVFHHRNWFSEAKTKTKQIKNQNKTKTNRNKRKQKQTMFCICFHFLADVVLYVYTSGTTGYPKAAIVTHIR